MTHPLDQLALRWDDDIPGLTLAWLLMVRQALLADGPLAREHFGIRSDELAHTLASLTAEQVRRLVVAMGKTPMLRIQETPGLALMLERIAANDSGAGLDVARMAHAAAAGRD